MKARRFMPVLVVAAGLLAYHNSFTGGLVFDDMRSIPGNPSIRHLWPIWRCLSPPHQDWLTVEGRPLINLSLAVNYALGGYNVWGYHALNLIVHVLAGLTLLGIVRRTLLQPALRGRFGAAANGLALATAVLWTVHPLQTESVTYIIQRAESIMGLFYLLTLYCLIRGVESPRPRLWYGLSVTACALGMASKEVMVSAPLMVLLYDRAFLSGSLREAWRRRRPLYLALASTWLLLGFVLVSAGIFTYEWRTAQGLGLSRSEYLATEPGVILYYLRLCAWPSPLCLNRQWPIATTWMTVLPPTVVVLFLLGASAWAWRRNLVWGFVGAWFFLTLAPSSSFIPLEAPYYEHRMYLPLAPVVSVLVIGLYSLFGRRGLVVFVAVGIGLGFLTWQRNRDYRSEITICADVMAKWPENARAHYNLGVALGKAGRNQEEVEQYVQALRLKPDYADAHYNLGVAAWGAGNRQEAIKNWEEALHIRGDDAMAHYNLGSALLGLGRVPEAIEHYDQALQIKPGFAQAHYNLGVALEQAGRVQEAVEHYEQALRINPEYADAHNNLGVVLWHAGKVPEAMGHYEQALRIKPDYAEAHNNLANALFQAGRVPEAFEHWTQALRLNPNLAEAHFNSAVALEQAGRIQEALGHYEQALRLKPDFVEAQNKLARLRAVQ